MKRLGYLLIVGGFLAGSYTTVLAADGVPVAPYLFCLGLGIVGVVIVRRAIHQESRHEGVIASNLGSIGSSLEQVVAKIQALDREKDAVDVYELRHRIDREFPDDLDAFVQARESVAHRFGLQAYAELMNPFAAGERCLNRVWSTSTDGYVDEAHTYIGKAREQFEEALAVFRTHHKAG
jgi:hypothetical protein